ncbi:uncharacterized protein LOC112589677 [Harpegnathos saltator]|nr:uncharacterized protein LOC112589677 [Harpegnathos saltator]
MLRQHNLNMSTLRNLLVTRAKLKGQLRRINNFLSTEQNITQAQAKTRAEKIDEIWTAFNNNQTQIEMLKAADESQLEEVIKAEESERITFEKSYYEALDKVRAILTPNFARVAVSVPHLQNKHVDARTNQVPGMLDIKLPTLTLPTFNGTREQWMPFKDSFTSIIHKNPKLTEIQKLQYLRDVLKDEALQVINSSTTSVENYTVAWDLLANHYDNERLIINSHLAQLLNFPQIVKEKPVSLKQFIIHIRTHLKALEDLGLPVNQWNAIIISLAKSKLDCHLQHEWEEEVNQRALDMSTTEEFLNFLNERYRMLEVLERNQDKYDQTIQALDTITISMEEMRKDINIKLDTIIQMVQEQSTKQSVAESNVAALQEIKTNQETQSIKASPSLFGVSSISTMSSSVGSTFPSHKASVVTSGFDSKWP